ncbi:MAG: ABC transporter permease [Microbacteriaceae bacterium]|nr:MAG: ABC transporter permease [Microbacteriaceae bacterium]
MPSSSRSVDRVRPVLIGGAALAAGVLIWWAIAVISGLPAYILPTPGATLQRAIELFGTGAIQIHIAQTIAEVLQGAIIGIVLGMMLAMVFFHIGWVRKLLMPIIVVAQVTPKISIAPLIILWIGLGIGSKITLVALVVFYPVLINMLARLESIPSTVRDLAHITGMGPVRRAFRIEFPYSLPALAAGVQLGLLQGVTAAVIGEFIGTRAGLGYLEKQGQDNDDIRLVMVTLALLAALGVVLYLVVGLIERRVSRRFE